MRARSLGASQGISQEQEATSQERKSTMTGSLGSPTQGDQGASRTCSLLCLGQS